MGTNIEENKKVRDLSEVMEIFGKYQIVQYCLACLPAMFVTMININYVFVAGDLAYRCRIPECEGTPPISQAAWWPNNTIDRCSKPLLKNDFYVGNDTCTANSFTGNVSECTEWIYESNNTIVADLNLACQPWKSNLIGTIHNIGMLGSMLVTGWMSDRFGRKPTMIFCAVGSCVGHLKTLTSSYSVYVVVEFLESFISGGLYPATLVTMMEIGGKKNRILAGVTFSCVIYVGESIFACIAMLVPYWKTLVRIIYSPPILVISYIFLIRESPRWQILNGQIDKAKETLKIIADINKININKEDLRDADDTKLKQTFKIESCVKREGYIAIFTSREILKRLLVASVCRFTTSFVFYGLIINSTLLPGNKYMNFLLSSLMSFPGEFMALYLMNKVGRKIPLMCGFLFSGILCVASAYVPTTWAKITLFLIGKMIISACFTGGITYAMELYPTSTRGSLMGLGSFMSRTGAMLAPLTPMLTSISPALPFIFFTGSALASSILLTLTPETKDLALPDTIQQVDTNAKAAKEIKNINKVNTWTDTLLLKLKCISVPSMGK